MPPLLFRIDDANMQSTVRSVSMAPWQLHRRTRYLGRTARNDASQHTVYLFRTEPVPFGDAVESFTSCLLFSYIGGWRGTMPSLIFAKARNRQRGAYVL